MIGSKNSKPPPLRYQDRISNLRYLALIGSSNMNSWIGRGGVSYIVSARVAVNMDCQEESPRIDKNTSRSLVAKVLWPPCIVFLHEKYMFINAIKF